jgi:hypothetical protein
MAELSPLTAGHNLLGRARLVVAFHREEDEAQPQGRSWGKHRRADGGAEEAGAEERRKERAARRSGVSSAAKAARRGADGRNAR